MRKLIIAAAALVIIQGAQAQSGGLSPYSRFGIGVLDNPGGATHAGMGGLTTPVWDAFSINFSNPATYSSLFRTTFQLGVGGSFLTLSDSARSQQVNGGGINEFGFVFKKQGSRWAFALGLVPYSSVNYSLSQKTTQDSIGDILYTYDGDGGLNKAIAGVSRAFRLGPTRIDSKAHRLSIGANVGYFFGSLQQSRKVIFSDVNYYQTRINSFTSIYGLAADVGLHYLRPLHEERDQEKLIRSDNLIGALTYSVGNNLSAKFTELAESFYYFSQVEVPLDTASFTDDVKGKVVLPERIAVGIGYVHTNRDQGYVMVGLDFKTQDWTKYTSRFGDTEIPGNLHRSSMFSIGMEIVPKTVEKSKNFLDRNTYRLGFRNTQTYLLLRDREITEMAVTAGISLPMISSKSTSKFNLAVEFGSGGTTEHDLLRQNFVNIMAGFSFSPHVLNNWFVSRKYE